MGKSEHSVSWFHRLGSFVAVLTFLLYMTGVLAADAEPGASTPALAWLRIGSLPAANPPGKYAHAYTILAAAVGALTLIFVAWLWKSNSRRYLKTLGAITVGVFLALILLLLSPAQNLFSTAASIGYTCGIQIFFCLTVCLALFTRTDWRWDEFKMPDLASPSIRQILVFTTVAVFVQPLLGERFREIRMGIAPHLVLGIAVTVCALWVMEMALTKFPHLRTFKISAVFLAGVVGLQLFLGIIDYSMVLNARAVPDLQPGTTVMNVTHAAIGALVLATSLFVTCQGFKYFAPAGDGTSSAIPGSPQDIEMLGR